MQLERKSSIYSNEGETEAQKYPAIDIRLSLRTQQGQPKIDNDGNLNYYPGQSQNEQDRHSSCIHQAGSSRTRELLHSQSSCQEGIAKIGDVFQNQTFNDVKLHQLGIFKARSSVTNMLSSVFWLKNTLNKS